VFPLLQNDPEFLKPFQVEGICHSGRVVPNVHLNLIVYFTSKFWRLGGYLISPCFCFIIRRSGLGE